eukprot:COSAG04_NODE_72_length_29124_cov_43.127265_11_plen_41_part_00
MYVDSRLYGLYTRITSYCLLLLFRVCARFVEVGTYLHFHT